MSKRRLFLHLFLLHLVPVVSAQAQRIAEIQIAPPFMRMAQDAQAQLTATAYDMAGAPVDVRLRWTSSNINIASVGTDGMVRAIAPGSVVITVSAETEGRRIVTRATVMVQRPPMRPGTVVVTTMPAPGQPTEQPQPAMPPGMPPRVFMAPMTDSIMRAGINCNEPFMNVTNPMKACWDVRAALRDSVQLPERPATEQCSHGPSRVTLLIQVNEHGRVDGVLPFSQPTCGDYMRAVIEMARRLTFTPAELGGKPVRAWIRLQVGREERR